MRDAIILILILCAPAAARAQDPPPAAAQDAATTSPNRWMFMYDGVVFATYNHQGGPRGEEDLVATNWAMGMATRRAGPGQLTLTGMISLDPATVGPRGYGELFQVG